MTITSVINIDIKVDLPSVNKNVDLPSVNKNKKIWQKFKNIIKYNISHTPSDVAVLVSIIFSHTPEEAMSDGLAKACVPSKNQFCSREIEFLNSPSIFRMLYAHSLGLHHYSINSFLYLRTIQDTYIALYMELITKLHTYASAIRVFLKGYLPNTLIKPVKLKEILNEVRKTL